VIDGGINQPWPPEVLEVIDKFQVGDLIEKPPFFYAADCRWGVWDLTISIAGGDAPAEGVELLELDPEDAPPYGLITYQTCDVTEAGIPEKVQPWFQIAPVYEWSDGTPPDRLYLAQLTAPNLENFVADLRIEFPLEKSVLVGREPIEGFATEADRIAFADQLGYRHSRAVLADAFHDVIFATMQEKKKGGSGGLAKRLRKKVYKLRLAFEEGTRLRPVAVKLVVVTHAGIDEETHTWFEEWWDFARVVAEQQGMNLLPNEYWHADAVDVRRYDEMTEMRNPLL
jgi:hypothetical protein